MKGIIKTAVAAAVVAGVAAQPHNHGHRHLHKKHDHAVEKRGTVIVTEVVEGPTVVEYIMDGKVVDESKAKEGISAGLFVVMGESKPTFSAPPPAVTTSAAGPDHGGQFFEKSTSATPTTSAAPPPTSSAAPPPPPPPPKKQNPVGLNADFPSGEIKCGKVPTEYGAVEIPWTGTNGWTTLANLGKWIKGVSVDNIHSPISGTCMSGMMCSYACPPGYQKTQWPENEQGATGQSVGGLWCNDDGFLELTRPSVKTLCEQGAGGVFIRNELSGNAAVCRTDYPGNEAMVIPLETSPGSTYPLTNPDSSTYYKWQGKVTTAQYYVNNLGVEVEEACTWNSAKYPKSAGNWAPTNIGVGKSTAGETYISIFPNLPTSNAVLNFDIEITGDISGTCSLKKGQYSGNNGCTVRNPSRGFHFRVSRQQANEVTGRYEAGRQGHHRLQERLLSDGRRRSGELGSFSFIPRRCRSVATTGRKRAVDLGSHFNVEMCILAILTLGRWVGAAYIYTLDRDRRARRVEGNSGAGRHPSLPLSSWWSAPARLGKDFQFQVSRGQLGLVDYFPCIC